MKGLRTLLERLDYTCLQGTLDREIADIVYDSRKVGEGDLFVCIRGTQVDSHSFAAQAAGSGAAALLVEEPVNVPENVTVIQVADTRYAMACVSAAYFDYPAEKMKIIGITGTKGKTTTTYMVKSILDSAGHHVGLIGTIEIIIGKKAVHADHTTPESYLIQKYFAQMAEAGCDIVVMEVSSQGFKMHRTACIPFELGIFTNIEPDHIGPGEHESFEEYMACKGMLFRQCKKGIVNIDDVHWKTVLAGHTCSLETFGFSEEADFRAADTKLVSRPGYLGIAYRVQGKMEFPVEIDIP